VIAIWNVPPRAISMEPRSVPLPASESATGAPSGSVIAIVALNVAFKPTASVVPSITSIEMRSVSPSVREMSPVAVPPVPSDPAASPPAAAIRAQSTAAATTPTLSRYRDSQITRKSVAPPP
jgi:hypothetical protein